MWVLWLSHLGPGTQIKTNTLFCWLRELFLSFQDHSRKQSSTSNPPVLHTFHKLSWCLCSTFVALMDEGRLVFYENIVWNRQKARVLPNSGSVILRKLCVTPCWIFAPTTVHHMESQKSWQDFQYITRKYQDFHCLSVYTRTVSTSHALFRNFSWILNS